MFDGINEQLRKMRDARAQAKAQEALREQQRLHESEQMRRAEQERQKRIHSIRIITGEVRYRYAILDTLRAFAVYQAEPGQPINPTEATLRASRTLQEQAVAVGADAVIHAQYNIVRYTIPRGKYADIPVYEAHVFGTAIKILGPPVDWASQDDGGL